MGLRQAIKDLDLVITDQLSAHPDGVIFSSFPHAGTINAAQLLAEWEVAASSGGHIC